MDTHVYHKMRLLWEELVTCFTSCVHISRMDTHVRHKIVLSREWFVTYITRERLFSRMNTHVCLKSSFLFEYFSHILQLNGRSVVWVSMCDTRSDFLNHRLVTQITRVEPFLPVMSTHCVFTRAVFSLNDLLHISQLKGSHPYGRVCASTDEISLKRRGCISHRWMACLWHA